MKPNYYAIIPATVRYDSNLSNSQKIMFGEITALSYKSGYCYASNNYFAKLYGVDPSTVSKWITGLKENGYIRVEYDKKGKQITKRRIRALMDKGGIEINQQRVLKKSQGGIEKTAKNNTTSNNTTSNIYTGEFEEFWDLYDVKKGKKKAAMEWKKLSAEDKEKIFENVPIFKTHFSSDQYTPRPRKYLYNRYWEDEDYQEPRNQTNKNYGKEKSTNRTESFFARGKELFGEGGDQDA